MPLQLPKRLNKRSALVLLTLLLTVEVSAAHASNLVILNTTIISPERSEPLRQASVLVRNGAIEMVTGEPFDPPDGVPVLDGSDLFLVPGLMDSHLHTLVIPGLGFQGGERSRTFARMTALYEQQFERSLLYFGITQFLDPAATTAAIERMRSRKLAPDMFHCGAAPLFNGYPTLFMDRDSIKELLPYRIYETPLKTLTQEPVDLSRHTPEAVVRRMTADGAICLKLFFEDGWDMNNGWPMLSNDSTERVIRAAKASNLRVIGHANALDMQQLAVDSGVDVLGHGLWNWNEHSRQPGMPKAISQHLDQVHRAGIGYQPTLRVMDSMRELFIPGNLDNPVLKKVVPAELINWYKTEAAQQFKRELAQEDFDNLPDDQITRLLLAPIGRSERSLRYLADAGHDLLLASDHPATPGHANHPGLSSYQELMHMAAIGVPLDRVFAAATINNPKMFGLADRYGSIEAGKTANMLLLESSPLEAIEAYDQIRWIILGGQPIARESLAADMN